MIWASVDLPLPGGPQKITEVRRSCSIARRKSVPGPTTPSCPENSSSVRGRIRAAKGATGSKSDREDCVDSSAGNRLSGCDEGIGVIYSKRFSGSFREECCVYRLFQGQLSPFRQGGRNIRVRALRGRQEGFPLCTALCGEGEPHRDAQRLCCPVEARCPHHPILIPGILRKRLDR